MRRLRDTLGRYLLVLLNVPDSVLARLDAVERGEDILTERVENLERMFLVPDFPPEEKTP